MSLPAGLKLLATEVLRETIRHLCVIAAMVEVSGDRVLAKRLLNRAIGLLEELARRAQAGTDGSRDRSM